MLRHLHPQTGLIFRNGFYVTISHPDSASLAAHRFSGRFRLSEQGQRYPPGEIDRFSSTQLSAAQNSRAKRETIPAQTCRIDLKLELIHLLAPAS